MTRGAAALVLVFTATLVAQDKVVWEDLPGVLLSNNKIELTVVPEGGAMAQIVLKDDKEKINPLWNPYAIARQAGVARPTNFYRGHFVCVDGFGPSSTEERDAGLNMHGEAHAKPWELRSFRKEGSTTSAAFSVNLPLAQESFTRTFHVVDGENIVWVESELTNLLAFDRPVFWGEHATVSAPFLEPGKVAVDMPVSKSKTKAYQPAPVRRLQSFVDFTWPMAPTLDGKMFDVRTAPMTPGTTDHTTSLIDPARRLAYITGFASREKADDRLGVPARRISVGTDVALVSGSKQDGAWARVRHAAVRSDARRSAGQRAALRLAGLPHRAREVEDRLELPDVLHGRSRRLSEGRRRAACGRQACHRGSNGKESDRVGGVAPTLM
jgi:hypothetical protein